MVYHPTEIGQLMRTKPGSAAYKLRRLLDASNGNAKLVASVIGVNERQIKRWIVRLLKLGVADLRRYRARIRSDRAGQIHLDARGRAEPLPDDDAQVLQNKPVPKKKHAARKKD